MICVFNYFEKIVKPTRKLLILFVCFLSSCEAGSDSAPDSINLDIASYTLNYYDDKNGFSIGDYRGDKEELFIPEEATINGKTAPIIEIGPYAFANRSNIKKIHLSCKIQSIGEYAFHKSGVEDLYVTPYLLQVDQNAFANCDVRFYEKDGIKYLPSSKGNYAFATSYNGKANSEITLSKECEAVYDDVFTGSQKIKTSVNMKSFGSTSGNYLPWNEDINNIEIIKAGNRALSEWIFLKQAIIVGNLPYIGSESFSKCLSLTSLILPETVTTIGDKALYCCTSIKEFELPKHIQSIGESAFEYCSSLRSIYIPNTVTEIKSFAFKNCPSLKIYCETQTKPDGWASDWNASNRPVTWGIKR